MTVALTGSSLLGPSGSPKPPFPPSSGLFAASAGFCEEAVYYQSAAGSGGLPGSHGYRQAVHACE